MNVTVEPDDLEPLTLRQKVANKRFNKQFDNIVSPVRTIGLGVIGYGAVKPLIDATAGGDFPFETFLFSLLVGVALIGGVTYFQNKLLKREE